jgi:hypothetical protein
MLGLPLLFWKNYLGNFNMRGNLELDMQLKRSLNMIRVALPHETQSTFNVITEQSTFNVITEQ